MSARRVPTHVFHSVSATTSCSDAIHRDLATPSKRAAHRTKMIIGGKMDLSKDFDQIAIVVDWLDACRARDLEALLDLYAQDASLECVCNDRKIFQGRADLASYWRPRLGDFLPAAFGVGGKKPDPEGAVGDYTT